MFNFSKQTKSFLALLFIAAVSVIASYHMSKSFEQKGEQALNDSPATIPQLQDKITTTAQKNNDVGEWVNYKDKNYNISFSYPKSWHLKTFKENKTNGLYVIALDPGKGAEMIRIYVSPDDYFALEGLPVKKTTMGGKTVLDVADMLFGIKDQQHFYTFDLGGNLNYQPQFTTMVEKVDFK